MYIISVVMVMAGWEWVDVCVCVCVCVCAKEAGMGEGIIHCSRSDGDGRTGEGRWSYAVN